ncbi:uncharacterized protein LOC132624327 [Lycium barbarum]|uniref:uncharacterized protein LOC132624327 n=1 Tax=Lycium barbarum TaxID=112863 RepID=UPI00293ED61F|nr:uncharacterized protein LOC132624327 [Lycium barbarum]
MVNSVPSAWEKIRKKNEVSWFYHQMWTKKLQFKIAFILWRVWKQKLPMDDVLARMGISIVSICRYCSQPQQETLEHIFLAEDYATTVWKVFTDAADIQGPFVQAAPTIRLWQLWKRMNTVVHGGTMSKAKVLYDINMNLVQLAKLKYP